MDRTTKRAVFDAVLIVLVVIAWFLETAAVVTIFITEPKNVATRTEKICASDAQGGSDEDVD